MSLTLEQIEQRKGLITASDAAAILGLNPWKGPIDVWNEKVNGGPPFRGNYKTRRGHAVEPLLLEWLGEKKAPLVMKPAGAVTLVHPVLTWLGATPDALFYRGPEGGRPIANGEAKSTGLIEHWTDESGDPQIPDYYHPQVVVQMAVTNAPRTFVVAEMIDPRESEPWILEVERDMDLEAIILEELDDFRRKYIETRECPPLDDASYRQLAAVFRRPKFAELVPASPEDVALAAEYLAASKAAKEASDRAEAAKTALCARIGDREGIIGDGWRVHWKERAAQSYQVEKPAYRHFDLREVKAATAKKGRAA